MAKVTITIEDIEGGKVKVKSDPTFETFMKKQVSGERLTSADGYAMSALNHIRAKSKEQQGIIKVGVPRIVT